jgi:hypothetical protein
MEILHVKFIIIAKIHEVLAGSLVRLEVIFNWNGIVHNKFIPECANVSKEGYLEMLTILLLSHFIKL